MISCPSCSSEISEASRFCSSCGTSLSSQELIDTQALPSAASSSVAVSQRRAGHRHTGGIVDDGRFHAGQVIADRYRIMALIGHGGMGEVYRATDLKLSQQVALKFLPDSVIGDEAVLERFHNEVRIARQVSHPNVCRVFDIGDYAGQPYISMEYVDGEDLGSLLRRIGRVPHDKGLEMSRQLCAGLAAAHDKGVLHRDLKPANIMIDGRGQLLIMDFGLAEIAQKIAGQEVRHGTPAYMAPEQLTGKEVSVRSDIYSLGLVLYELFTGRRAFEASTLAELIRLREHTTPLSLGSLVQELDPAVERVVLRCLDPDPAHRPATALAVSAALPGGDPLAAALAAGETPSPAMVAAAGYKEGLHPWAAIAVLTFIVAGLLVYPFLHARATWLQYTPLEEPADVLAEKSRELEQSLGYQDRPADHAYGFDYARGYLDYVDQHPGTAQAATNGGAGQPSAIRFWYRSSPRFLVATGNNGQVSDVDPPMTISGMISVQLDTHGRLLRFAAVPKEVDPAAENPQPADWSQLFTAAGLDPAKFKPAIPSWTPLATSDMRKAWTGPEALRVEGASWKGKPIYFHVIGPWTRPGRQETPPISTTQKAGMVFGLITMSILLVGACVLARRNVKMGRGDRRGAMRLAGVLFLITVAGWALSAHHAPQIDEFSLVARGLSTALMIAALVWLLYIALEPYVRRRWPQTMISWSRILEGRWRDPLVGSHVLIGIATGILMAGSIGVMQLIQMRSGGGPAGFLNPSLLSGPLEWCSYTLSSVPTFVLEALAEFLALFLLRTLLRKEWIAASAFVLLAVTFAVLFLGLSTWTVMPLRAVEYVVMVLVLMNFGLVSLAVANFVIGFLLTFPITADWSVWYTGASLYPLLVVAALAAFAFQSALAGRKFFPEELL
jgi:serine/threonine-protein kinase